MRLCMSDGEKRLTEIIKIKKLGKKVQRLYICIHVYPRGDIIKFTMPMWPATRVTIYKVFIIIVVMQGAYKYTIEASSSLG